MMRASLSLILMLVGLPCAFTLLPAAEISPGLDEFRQQAERCRRLLRSSVVDFYLPHCVDGTNGGYFQDLRGGRFASSGEKFLTLQARQLWSFSIFAEEGIERAASLSAARSGYDFIQRRMWDAERGGYFSKVDDRGAILDDRKHAYLNSFALYGLAAYFRASGDSSALQAAKSLFQVFELRFRDRVNGGYHEFFHRDWLPVTDDKAGRYVGAIGTKTYNTHLHLLEAFAELYRAWPDPLVARRLQELIVINTSTILHPEYRCNLDGWWPDWRRVETPQNLRASYGHDVECVWLVLDAARTVGLAPHTLRSWAETLAGYSLTYGFDSQHGGFFYSGELGKAADDTKKEWWVQAEALVGLLTLYQETGQPRYYRAFRQTLDFTEAHLVAKEGSWWATRNADGSPSRNLSRTSMWQGAYHNGRALLWSARILEALGLQRKSP
ncbi:MAG: AGE family epimerase/isomerase [Verrucomicrobiales bacterium]|nr:AGE family epimerase/isomerase [Verrucomicrobiales bacterium]